MIASYIGFDVFFKGMRLYLSRHAYANAVTNDVWGALEEASGSPVVDIMTPWTLQVGFPILLLNDDSTIELTRFLAGGRADSDNSWPVPVTARVEGIAEVQGPWMINGPDKDELGVLQDKIKEWAAADKWFKLNVDQTGFFRVCYTRKSWMKLAKVMDLTGPLSTADRLGLLSDSFAAGKAGYSSIADTLQLVSNFGSHDEAEYALWQELSDNLSSLANLFRSEDFYPQFQKFLRKIYSRQMDKLGWESKEGEPQRTGTLRGTIIRMMGLAGDEAVIKESYDRFMAFKQSPDSSPIDGDLRGPIFRCALRHDEATVAVALKQLYETSSFPEEQRTCLSVLGCVKDEKLHAEMLRYTLFSGNVRVQDISFPLASLATSSDSGGVATWEFFVANFARLYADLASGPMWPALVGFSVRGIVTPELADEADAFFKEHGAGSGDRRLSQAMEIVRTNIRRRECDRDVVREVLGKLS
jgi:aminopeptidase N